MIPRPDLQKHAHSLRPVFSEHSEDGLTVILVVGEKRMTLALTPEDMLRSDISVFMMELECVKHMVQNE